MLDKLPSVSTSMSVAGVACFAMSAVAARKFIAAGTCKGASTAMALFGKQNAALDKAGQTYFTQAKKDAFHDLTAVVGFAVAGVAANYGADALKTEPGFFDFIDAPENRKWVVTGVFGTLGSMVLGIAVLSKKTFDAWKALQALEHKYKNG